jgi:NADPH:quinone reductase
MVKTAMGWNFASSQLGEKIMREIIELVQTNQVRAVVGNVVDFADLPGAIEAMANRETTGRTIAMVEAR